MGRKAWLDSACLAVLACSLAGAASAQDAVEQASAADGAVSRGQGVQVFDRGFFQVYNAVTALDMVQRVPGFTIDDGDDRRGFGATAGNVLVNGERPSSKTAISEQLQRIPADSVMRIELVSGASSELDIRGQTQVVNVVLDRSQRADSPLSWILEARHIQYSDRIGYTVQGTKTFALSENANLTLDLQFPNLHGRTESIEAIRDPSGQLIQIRDNFGQPSQNGVQGSGALSWRPTARDTINANFLYNPTWDQLGIGSFYTAPDGSFDGALTGLSEFEDKYNAEFGGDWERRFSDAWSAKVLGLYRDFGEDQSDRFDFFGPSGALVGERRQMRSTEGGERVGRGVLTWRAGGGHTLEFGGETAFNFLDTAFDITFDAQNGAGPQPVRLPVANARAEEVRWEAFVTDIWNVTPAITLETGFTYEASTIKQTGDAQKERELSYPKPRLVGSWQATENDQFRLSIERDVSQLDFNDFASSVDVRDENQQLGNADLEPEKSWQTRLEWDRRFGERGALTIGVFHDEIEDVDDTLALAFCDGDVFAKPLRSCLLFPTDPRDVFDAVGNIGDGTSTGVDVSATMPLDWIGIPRSELRLSGELQETEVTDPVTGEKRRFRFAEDWEYALSFRQELPQWNLAWGFETDQESSAYEYRLAEEVKLIRQGHHVDVFVETTAIAGITLRFGVSNITAPTESRVRTFFDPNRASGVVDEVWTRKQKGGPYGTRVFSVRASGTF